MGKRINESDPLYRTNKPLWNATVALKRESEKIVAQLLKMGFEVPTISKGTSKSERIVTLVYVHVDDVRIEVAHV